MRRKLPTLALATALVMGLVLLIAITSEPVQASPDPGDEWHFPPSVVLLVLVLGMIGDFAYLYFKVAKVKNLISGGEAIAGVLIFLVVMVILWGIAYGLVSA